MRKNLDIIAAIAVFLAVSPFAQAANDFYIGTSLERITDKGDLAPAIHPRALAVKGGIALNPYFAVEARYTTGIKSGDAIVSGVKVDLDVDHLYGAYVKGMMPIGGVSPYLLVGYSHGKETATVKAYNMKQSDSASGSSFGIGIDIPITQTLSFNAEWARFVKGKDDAGVGSKVEGLSAGVAMYF